MKIKVAINQAEAFRQGIDAPAATARVDLDPQQLSEDERQLVSALLVNGNDLSGSSLSLRHRDYRLALPPEADALSLELLHATPEALIERVRAVAAEHRDTWARYDRQMHKKADAALREAVKDRETRSVKVAVTAQGDAFRADSIMIRGDFLADDVLESRPDLDDGDIAAMKTVTVPVCPKSRICIAGQRGPDYLRWASEAVARQYHEFRDVVISEQRRIVSEAIEELQGEPLAAYRRARQEEEEDYKALYQRLPEALRDRKAAGFADQQEVIDAISDLILRDAGIDPADAPAYTRPVGQREIDDEAFKDLQSICERFGVDPSEAAIIGMGADCGWRKPRPDDTEGMITRDGEVWDDGRKPRLLVRIDLDRAGLEVTGFVPVADIGTGAAMFRSARRDDSVPE